MMNVNKYQGVDHLSRSCRGITLVCNFGYQYLACKPEHKPADEWLNLPLMEFWTCKTLAKQFISNLDQWKNDSEVLGRLFSYLKNDEHAQANYNQHQVAEFIALQLEQRLLLIFPVAHKQALFSNNKLASAANKSTKPIVLKSGNKVVKAKPKVAVPASVPKAEPASNTESSKKETNQIELKQGKKGSWNKELNGKLKPNSKYKVGNYTYDTDDLGRVKSVSGDLDLTKQDRNTHQQGKAGKENGIKDGLDKDEGGHIIASIFNGPGEQINYSAMDGNLNKGAWKRMENKWAKALKGNPPKKVNVSIDAIYEGNDKRPEAFDVTYIIDDKKKSVTLVNQAGG